MNERNDYYPYGERHANPSLTTDATSRWRFSAKEIQTTASVNLLDFGARMYDDRLCRWTTQDPMAEKYYGFSPYVYCAGEPVNRLDVFGCTVIAKDKESQRNIKSTLNKADARFVSFNRQGVLNSRKLSNHASDSNNYSALKKLSDSSIEYNISVSDSYISKKGPVSFRNGDIQDKGVTLIPGAPEDASPDSSVHIITNSALNKKEQATNLAHEAYGHALFYQMQQEGQDVNPFHEWVPCIIGEVWDNDAGFVVPINGRKDNNTALAKQIENAVKEVNINFE